MNMNFFAASAAAVCLMFSAPFIASSSCKGPVIALEASADYEFEFIDETKPSENADEIEEFDYNEYDFDGNGIQDNGNQQQGYEPNDFSAYEGKTSEYNPFTAFIISLIIGLVVALIAVSAMKASMRSVHRKAGALEYRKESNLKLERNQDTFLGKKVDKTPIARVNPPQGTSINTKR